MQFARYIKKMLIKAEKFKNYIQWLNKIASNLNIKIIFSVHPRTKINIKSLK